jgi:N-terminal domain of (some) glycogen debranching enzymes
MTAPPTPFNSGDPVNIGFGGATVTLVEGATFCLSDGRGDVLAGRSHGLFVRDARVLSRSELQVDGQPAEPLSVRAGRHEGRAIFGVVVDQQRAQVAFGAL